MTLIPPPPKAALSGGGPQRKTFTFDAPTSAGALLLPPSFVLLRLTATAPGRFRLYRDAASRDGDFNRNVGMDLEAARGLLLEAVLTLSRLDLPLAPVILGASLVKGDPCAWAWEGALGTTLSLDLFTLENP